MSPHYNSDPDDVEPDADRSGVSEAQKAELSAELHAMHERDLAAAKLEAAERNADADQPPDLMKNLKDSLDAARRGDPETMPVDLPEDETERIDADAVSPHPPTLDAPDGFLDEIVDVVRTFGDGQASTRPINREGIISGVRLRQRIPAGWSSRERIGDAIDHLLATGRLIANGDRYDTGQDELGARDRILRAFEGAEDLGSIHQARRERDKALEGMKRAESIIDRERERADQLALELAGREVRYGDIIASRARRAAAQSLAWQTHQQALEALHAFQTIAAPLDADQLRSLALAVAATGEAIDNARHGVGEYLERQAFGSQLQGQLAAVRADLRRLGVLGEGEAPDDADLIEHLRSLENIIRELTEGVDYPSWDRGADPESL